MLFFYVCLNIQTLVGSFSNELVERGEKHVHVVNLPPPAWSSGLLSGSSDQGLPEAASEGKSGVSGAGGQQDLCWRQRLISSSRLPCSDTFTANHFPVTAVQHMVFVHVFYLFSADFSPCVIFFFLRSKAERKSLLFCQWKGVLRRRFPGKRTADPCAPTELLHLSLHGRCAASLPGSFACISHSSSGHSFRVQSPQ